MPMSRAGKRRSQWVCVEQLHGEGCARLSLHGEHIADDPRLNEDLDGLHQPRRQHAPLLHLAQHLERNRPLLQRPGKNIGRGDCVLNGEIDADAADRRHGVGRVADAQQAGLIPALQPVDTHGQELHVVPGGDLLHA